MNKTIHQLNDLEQLKDTDEFILWDSEAGNSKKYAVEALRIPIGVILPFWGLVPPSINWLVCDGTDTTGTEKELAIVHPKLYEVLGNSNVLPDLRGRAPTNANYSTDEVKTGKTWIDGKPIYRKAGYKSGNVSGVILDSSLSLSYISSIVQNGGSVFIYDVLSSIGGYADASSRSVLAVRNNGLFFQDSSGSPHDCNWWIEYTKANDSAETNTMNFIIRAD